MRGAVAALGLVLAGWPLAAVGQTVIAPDIAAGRTLGTTVGQAGQVYTIAGGTRAGNNLFHSFAQFDLGAGDTARWTATEAATISNVVNRVTGGQASTLNGQIDSTALPNATFYFVNPAGIVFGPNAQVNVPAAAHFSTAGELRFANGDHFAIATPNGSTLSVAAPEAWGFLGGQGDISISGATTAFAPGNPHLSLAAGDITIASSTFGTGGLDLTAVGDGLATVALGNPLAATYTGDLRVRDSVLFSAATDTTFGPFRLAGGLIDFDNARLASDTAGSADGASLLLRADGIRIGRDSLMVTSSRGAGRGGHVEMTARELVFDNTGSATFVAGISSVATASGDAGSVRLTADNVLVQAGAFIGSSVAGSADAGNVEITATNFVIDSGIINTASLPGSTGRGSNIRLRASVFDFGAATITTQSFGSGRAGDVTVEGGSLLMSGGSLGSTPGGIADSGNLTINLTGRLQTDGAGFGVSTFNDAGTEGAGVITIRASDVLMQQSRVATLAGGQGAAGRVLIETGSLMFDEVTFVGDAKDGVGALPGLYQIRATGDVYMRNTIVRSNANGLADGGIIEIQGGNVELEGTIIQSDAISFGDAGRVLLTARNDLLLTNTQVSSNSNGQGAGGDVRVEARNVRLDVSSALSADVGFLGDAGQVRVTAQTLDLQNGSEITSEALSGTGDAGEVFIDVGRLTLSNGIISSTSFTPGAAGTVRINAAEIAMDGEGLGFTGIASETLGLGDGGDVIINAAKITLDGGALISTAAFDDAPAGDVSIVSNDLSLLNGSSIQSVALGFGAAGSIAITARSLVLKSDESFAPSAISSAAFGGDGGQIDLNVGSLLVDFSTINSDTLAGGRAGNVLIKADAITLRNRGGISSNTNSVGDAGLIDIQAKNLILEPMTGILSAATGVSDGGNAGAVTIAADSVIVGKGARITTATLSTGDAGQLAIRAKSLLIDGGAVSSSAEVGATGGARDVQIFADTLRVLNGGSIETVSSNPKPAGLVDIRAGNLLVDGVGSIISSENLSGRPEGMERPGPGGDAGTILIDGGNVIISNGGRVSTNSFAGAAGDITVSILRPGFFILEGRDEPGVIQTSSGPGTGGRITISDPLAVISNGSRILALGQQRGANVVIESRYFIKSTDRSNVIDVAGDFNLETGLYDVSSGITSRDLSVLDASKVLRGQCPAARSTGAVSQLITRPVGPYAREPLTAVPDPVVQTPGGGCP